MSRQLLEVGGDWGNWGAKVVASGKQVVIRNAAIPYDGSDDELRGLGLFGDNFGEPYPEEPTDSVRLTIGGQQWIVGAAAFNMAMRAHEQTSFARYGTDEWYALVLASFVALFRHQSGVLGLTFSLPVSQFRSGKHHQVKEILTGMHTVVHEGRQLNYEVREDMIDMVPEGFGSLVYMCVSEDGLRFVDRNLAGSRVILFDFGGFTLDIATYDALSIGPVNDSLTTGLINVRNHVNRALKSRYDRGDVPSNVLDEVIRTKRYKHAGGSPEDVSDIVDAALVGLMKDALRMWQEELGSGADFDTVIITGGGGPVIGPLLEAQLNHQDVRTIPKGQAHLANALGSLRYRKFKREYM
jgi:hypothetical protein